MICIIYFLKKLFYLFGEDEESFDMQKLTLARLGKFFGFLETEYLFCRNWTRN
jgi:hypothetical protein